MVKSRILMLMGKYSPIFSGQAIFIQKLVPLIKKNEYNVEILTGDFGKLPHLDIIDGVVVHRVPFDPKENKFEIKSTIRIICFLFRHRKEFDIFHIHGHMDYYGLLTIACKILRKKIIMQMVLMGADDPESLNAQYRFMWARLKILRLMDRFIYISKPLGESCKKMGFSISKLRYIPGGVDTKMFCPVNEQEKNEICSRMGLPPDRKIVSFVGAILYRKGLDILIDAWEMAQRAYPNAELVLIGPCEFGGEYANESLLNAFAHDIQRKISEHALNVRLVGESSKVKSFLQASDIFVLPSRKEGFGYVIIEAMSCGVPPIVSQMDGVSLEAVTPDKTGVIVNSCEELSIALIDLLKNDERRKKMGANAREDVLRRFALEHIANKYQTVYDELS